MADRGRPDRDHRRASAARSDGAQHAGDRLCVWARNTQQTAPATTPTEETDTIFRRRADPAEPDDSLVAERVARQRLAPFRMQSSAPRRSTMRIRRRRASVCVGVSVTRGSGRRSTFTAARRPARRVPGRRRPVSEPSALRSCRWPRPRRGNATPTAGPTSGLYSSQPRAGSLGVQRSRRSSWADRMPR
jgi:hypothetical protein